MLCSNFDQVCVFSGCSPSERLISRVGGQARSKTPNADMERSVYGADCTSTPTYLNKVTPTFITVFIAESLHMFISHLLDPFHSVWHFHPLQQTMLQDLRFGVEPDDGENLRRIGRSLSGTVVTSRRSRLTATRSFVSVPSCALLPPCGCAINCICLMYFTHCFYLCSSPLLFVLFLPFFLLFDFLPVLLLSACLPSLFAVSLKGEAGWCQCLSLLTSSLLSPVAIPPLSSPPSSSSLTPSHHHLPPLLHR